MSIKIVDGMGVSAHITSNDIVGKQQAMFGLDSCVFTVGHEFAATLVDSNTITIADGEACMKGCFWRVLPDTTETVSIASGSQAMYRYDVIVARYSKDTDGVETVELAVLQGTPSDTLSSAEVPEVTENDIRDGVNICEYALYQVLISGLTVESVTAVFDTCPSIQTLYDMSGGLYARVVTEIPATTADDYIPNCLYFKIEGNK